MRLAGCLTVPSKPTKTTRQGLAAKALQQAQEQLRHGQGAASQGARGTGCKKGPKKSRKLRLAGCLTLHSKPTKKTRQGLAAKALQQAQEQLRHGQGAARAPPRWTRAQWHGVQKATEKGPNRDARRVPNGTFENH